MKREVVEIWKEKEVAPRKLVVVEGEKQQRGLAKRVGCCISSSSTGRIERVQMTKSHREKGAL